jgi:hypothetical protein
MLTQVEVFTAGITASPLTVSDGDVSTDPIQIRSIDGLGPVKANINTSQYGSIDGEYFYGSNTPKRNIVLTVGLNPNWATQSVAALRRIVYSYFMPESFVKLRFTSTHLPVVEIEGYVESCEPNIFSPDTEIQISIVCPQPFFSAVSATAVSGPIQTMGDTATIDVNYEGDIATGFIVDIGNNALTYNTFYKIVNKTPTTQTFELTSATNTAPYNFMRLSTVKGDKFIRLYNTTDFTFVDELGKMAAGGSWMPLVKGVNKMQFQTDDPGYTWTLSYNAKYGGL